MRTAILSALLAVLPAISYGDDPKPKPAAEQPAPQQPPSVPQSPKATIPMAQPVLDPSKAPTPADGAKSPATDPLKMAAPAPAIGAKAPDAAPVGKNYVIGPEDVLRVTVWNQGNLSADVSVRPDGYISLNLIGEVLASGQTPEGLGKQIEERLKEREILKTPNVNIQIMQVKSRKYYIQGEVTKTGPIELVMPTTVLQALMNAGGFKDFANKKKIRILRILPDKTTKEFRFNYNEVTKGKHLEQNIYIEPGDYIIVP
jgi:polysaccharide export outer membrane protein